MITRVYVKCPVCGKITLVRYQMGFLEEHPIRFRCGNCGISIEGKYYKHDGIKFQNGIVIINKEEKVDYVIASSGELLTDKLEKVVNFEQTIKPGPFIGAMMIMEENGYEKLKEQLLSVLDFRDKFAYSIQNINDLYFRNTHIDLLKNELRKILPIKGFPLENKLDILRAVRHVNIIPFISFMGDEFESIDNFLISKIMYILNNNIEELEKFSKYLYDDGLLYSWEKQISVMYSQMLQQLNKFIPIINLQYYNITLDQAEKDYAITTVSFEEIEQLYVNLYELIADVIPLVVGMDNILERNDFQLLKTGHPIVKKGGVPIISLDELVNIKEKGIRVNYIDGSGVFEKLIYGKLDKDVRNSIGHFNYENEDVFNQTIKFKHLKNANRTVEKSLIRICSEIWDMYLTLFSLSELIYNLKRINLNLQGIKVSKLEVMDFDLKKQTKNVNKKIGRNDPCPCGSGKKYKKCCGANK
ncbi:SEC-C metal-binding domain-containing protein [Clostridium butyricum]|uniref:SEC-C motif domain protein n=1 Tax=Clostridium butyricum E4 str. BoNT E BL5262 TaxID=632245 RepID=C4IE33_CLOBU|nr:SEC-C metal-binding domain-containing protein [Clostridium butyricum]EDT73917.1 SEC-C motif domain protein [Clostridium butyricum 5521]EEP55103.1 SEC-C motif domain protein [Clostridium butyricum E4 str. BoNT E BL5262]NFL31979.1 zinc chelation protein SecC [Clostridium butyricum]NFS18763.1 zinc chelation protein SecC [Clostridium butyricum]